MAPVRRRAGHSLSRLHRWQTILLQPLIKVFRRRQSQQIVAKLFKLLNGQDTDGGLRFIGQRPQVALRQTHNDVRLAFLPSFLSSFLSPFLSAFLS